MRSSTLAKHIAELALTKKAHDVVTMDLRKLSPVSDFFVICTADSDSQARAIADAVEDGMEKEGSAVWHREAGSMSWVVLDYVDVVVHIFQKSARSYYSLERLWGDAKIVTVTDTPIKPKRKSLSAKKRRSPKKASKKRSAGKRVSKARRTSAGRLSSKAAS